MGVPWLLPRSMSWSLGDVNRFSRNSPWEEPHWCQQTGALGVGGVTSLAFMRPLYAGSQDLQAGYNLTNL